MKKKFLLICCSISIVSWSYSQGIGIGGTPNSSALLDLQSTSKGLLIPRMSKTDRGNISLPPTGLLIFQNTDTVGFYSNTGTPASPAWKRLDGAATVPAGTIVMSENFPDVALTAAGFNVFRIMYVDSVAQFGAYGNWSKMDTTNGPFNGSGPLVQKSAVGGSYIFTYGTQYSPDQSLYTLFNLTTNTWVKLTPPAGASAFRDAPFVLWTGTEFIIWGGNGANDGYRYNPATNIWTTMSPVNAPSPRDFPNTCFTGTHFIVWGGADAGTSTALTTGAKYNLANGLWSVMNPTNAPASFSNMSVAANGNAMFVYGGIGAGYVYSNKVSKYDVPTNIWTQYTPLGTAVPVRDNTTMFSHPGYLYISGGTQSTQFTSTQLADGYVYNIATNTWSANVGRLGYANCSVVQLANKLFTFGGNITGTTYTNEFFVRDIAAASPVATSLGTLPLSPRMLTYGDTLAGNRILFFGGTTFTSAKYVPYRDGVIYNVAANSSDPMSSDGTPPATFTGIGKTVAGKFTLFNISDPSNVPIKEGYIYTPDVNGFGNPQKTKLYLYKKN
ncbi:MAG: kelch repeat-containing protein [Chitinophagaceae bacterium]